MSLAELKPLAKFLQHGYVTSNLDEAMLHFAELGVLNFSVRRNMESQLPGGKRAIVSVAIAWCGPLQIELVEPVSGDDSVFRDLLPAEGFALRLHHHGFLAPDPETFEALRAGFMAEGMPLVLDGANETTGTRYFYADARAKVGHYLEYILLTEESARGYAQMPRND